MKIPRPKRAIKNPPPNVIDTILFIDDEPKACKYFAMLFGRNHEVLTAADGREGLQLFRRHRSRIGVVITDHIMPRMTGLDLLERMRSENARVTRILSTAYTDSGLVRAAESSGLIDYFVGKPWDLEKFESIVWQSFLLLNDRTPVEESCQKTRLDQPPNIWVQ
jgi:DNA-binding NtrC family response regulator